MTLSAYDPAADADGRVRAILDRARAQNYHTVIAGIEASNEGKQGPPPRDGLRGVRHLMADRGRGAHAARSRIIAGAGLCIACCLGQTSALSALQQTRWTVAVRPDAVIGSAHGEPDQLFDRIVGARFLPDERVVVADAGFLDLRIFGSDGSLLTRMGGRGRGPGEFEAIGAIWLRPDGSINVWDPANRRITTFGSDGGLHSTTTVEGSPGGGNLEVWFGALSNGDVLIASLHLASRSAEPAPDRWTLSRYASDGRFRNDLSTVRGMWRLNGYPIPFSPIPAFAVLHDSVFLADGYEPNITVYTEAGTPSRDIRLSGAARTASGSDWDALEAELKATGRQLYIDYLRRGLVPREGRVPHIASLIIDDRGHLWIRRYEPADAVWLRSNALRASPGGEWQVLRTDGDTIATVRMPSNMTPLEIRGDRILGVSIDSDDVQRLVIHRLVR